MTWEAASWIDAHAGWAGQTALSTEGMLVGWQLCPGCGVLAVVGWGRTVVLMAFRTRSGETDR